MASLEEKFNEMVVIVQNLPKEGELKVTDNDKLKFYSLYKQATIGPCNTTQPYFYQVVERAKWNAWDSVKELTKEEAMQGYLDHMKDVCTYFNKNRLINRI
jgi:acyl-CoA-binding protein